MPRLTDLERLKRDLAALSREPEILAQWGETMEEPAPPSNETEARPDEAPLPEPRGLAARAASLQRPGISKPARETPPDFASLLADLPLEPLENLGEGETTAAAPAGEDDLDLAALLGPALGEESSPPAEDSFGESAIQESPETTEKEAPEGLEDLDAFLATLGSEEAPEEEPPAPSLPDVASRSRPQATDAASKLEATAPTAEPDFGFSDLGSFGLPSEEAPGTEGEPEAAAPAAEEDFSFSDLGSFGFPAEGTTSPVSESEAAAPAIEEDFGLPDLGSFELPSEEAPGAEGEPEAVAPAAEEDFGFSDLGSFGLPAEEAPGAEGEPEAAAPAAEEDFGFSGLGSFGLPAEEAPGAEGESEAAAPAAEEDFGFSDLGSFGLPAEEAAGPAGEPATATSSAEDDFALPDLGGFELPGEEAPDSSPAKAGGSKPAADEFAGGFDLSGFELGEASSGAPPESDAFDSFSFEAPSVGLAGEEIDRELASLGEEAPAAETFNLAADWGEDFAMPEAPPSAGTARAASGRTERREPEEKIREVALTEAQVDRLQDNLLSLPLNLRVAVEDAIAGEKGSEAQRSRLVWMLVEGARLEELAGLAGRIQKRRIPIPEGFEKRTGAALEAERGSFRYLFVHSILPVLRTALLVLVAAGILGFLGYRFIYTPLAADSLYRTGYRRIAEDRYQEAEAAFGRAGRLREFKVWYYRYARAYAEKRQYILSEKKYEALLSRYPREYAGALEWAGVEREQLKYAEAARILQKLVLERDYLNKDALLLLGDVYLDWAEEDPRYYEEARRNYASLVQRYGQQDLYLERMLLYFIRTDKLSEVLSLKDRFLAEKKPSPQASTLAELGGYLFDKGRLEDVRRILTLAVQKDPLVPETHYHLARMFRRADSPEEERKALDNAIRAFERFPSLPAKRLSRYVDSLIRRGHFRFEGREYVAAEEDYAKAAAEYDRALELRRLGRSPRYAEAYAGLGDVAYWVRDDLDQALRLYERAAEHGFDNPELRYRRGYVHYRRERFAPALEQFYMAGREGGESPYLLFAFGNALYIREDFHAAEGYFRRATEALRTELDRIDLPVPQERASHEEIVELLMQAENNLGATLYRVANRMGDASLRASAMAAFAESARLFDALARDQRTLVRPDAKNLGFLNMDFILHPRRNIDIATYAPIERSMQFPRR